MFFLTSMHGTKTSMPWQLSVGALCSGWYSAHPPSPTKIPASWTRPSILIQLCYNFDAPFSHHQLPLLTFCRLLGFRAREAAPCLPRMGLFLGIYQCILCTVSSLMRLRLGYIHMIPTKYMFKRDSWELMLRRKVKFECPKLPIIGILVTEEANGTLHQWLICSVIFSQSNWRWLHPRG